MAARRLGSSACCRIHLLQQLFNLSDPAIEEGLYDPSAARYVVSIDLGCEPVPDETRCAVSATCLMSKSGQRRFDQEQRHRAAHSFEVAAGTSVDATVITA